jgi:hypothetical protein
MVIGGYANFHFQYTDIPLSTLELWDRKVLTAISKRSGCAENVAHIQHTLPNLCGKHHFKTLTSLYAQIQVSEAMIRLCDTGTIPNKIALAQLDELNILRCAHTCALSNPTNSIAGRINNPMVIVENCLHFLGFSIHTDTLAPKYESSRQDDKLILESIPAERRHLYVSYLRNLKLFYVSSFTTENGKEFITDSDAFKNGIIKRTNPTIEFHALRSELCEDDLITLKAQYIIGPKSSSPDDGQRTYTDIYYPPPRADPYSLHFTQIQPPILIGDKITSTVATGDGSALRHDKGSPAGYSMKGIQNMTTCASGRIPGQGGNFKAELVAQTAIFRSGQNGIPLVGITDNSGVQ